jgi:hypothetical protein
LDIARSSDADSRHPTRGIGRSSPPSSAIYERRIMPDIERVSRNGFLHCRRNRVRPVLGGYASYV